MSDDYKELLIGCGHSRKKRMGYFDRQEFANLTTLDMNQEVNPDVVWNLENLPYPFSDNEFNEIHAYHVLEHMGRQGDWQFFFDQFYEFWRILKPKGIMCIAVPLWNHIWTWGDPGHTRILGPGCFAYLSQKEYSDRLPDSEYMTDYRFIWKGDFDVLLSESVGDVRGDNQLTVYLEAVK